MIQIFAFILTNADDGGNKTQNPSGSPLDLRWPRFRGLASSLYCAGCWNRPKCPEADESHHHHRRHRQWLHFLCFMSSAGTLLSRVWHSSSTLTGGATLQPFCGWWVVGGRVVLKINTHESTRCRPHNNQQPLARSRSRNSQSVALLYIHKAAAARDQVGYWFLGEERSGA